MKRIFLSLIRIAGEFHIRFRWQPQVVKRVLFGSFHFKGVTYYFAHLRFFTVCLCGYAYNPNTRDHR